MFLMKWKIEKSDFFTKKHVGMQVYVENDNNLSLIIMIGGSSDLRVS